MARGLDIGEQEIGRSKGGAPGIGERLATATTGEHGSAHVAMRRSNGHTAERIAADPAAATVTVAQEIKHVGFLQRGYRQGDHKYGGV